MTPMAILVHIANYPLLFTTFKNIIYIIIGILSFMKIILDKKLKVTPNHLIKNENSRPALPVGRKTITDLARRQNLPHRFFF